MEAELGKRDMRIREIQAEVSSLVLFRVLFFKSFVFNVLFCVESKPPRSACIDAGDQTAE